MADIIYNRFFVDLMEGELDIHTSGDTVKMQLHTSSYTPDKDHNVIGDLTNEHAASGNYSTGGETLANQAVSQVDASDLAKWDADDVSWTTSTITARYAALIDVTNTNSLIACFDFGADKSSSSGTFTVAFNASGIMTLAQA